MPRVLLATFQLLPAGEPGGQMLLSALADRGIEASWAVWDDTTVPWSQADLVAVRSTWDYHRRAAEFLSWAERISEFTTILNGVDIFRWNSHKGYLGDLDVPTVPTTVLDDRTLVDGLAKALSDWGTVVVKPSTGAGGLGVCVVGSPSDPALGYLAPAPWVVQPLVESVRTRGERSVYVFGGRAASVVDKRTDGTDEVRVNEHFGGRSEVGVLTDEVRDLAEAAVRSASELVRREVHYARVDLLEYAGGLVVSELELIEPGLYLDVDPENADRFAELVEAVLRG